MPPLFEIRELPVSSGYFLKLAEKFLKRHSLRLDPRLDYLAGVYDTDDTLVGVGGLDNATVKCVALDESARGCDVAASLLSHLYSRCRERGADNITLFTKPENEILFSGLGFHPVGKASAAVMMESSAAALTDYLRQLRNLPRGRRNGVIVMNANPMTVGHRHLISYASREVDCLTVIPVADDKTSLFSYEERRDILTEACRAFSNVTVAPGSIYAISAATFPSYFLKRLDDASVSHMELDIDIFIHHIAPALGASVRFVGEEPSDQLTAAYNCHMRSVLPQYGVEVIEIPRLCEEGSPVSASKLRKALADFNLKDALRMAVPETIPALLAKGAAMAMTRELELTPKPGLVDLHDNGAHRDMDPSLMRKSIEAVYPWFRRMAKVAMGHSDTPDLAESLVAYGHQAERSMLQATGGVNTHRGAIFCMGLFVAASSRIISENGTLTSEVLSSGIASIAECIPEAGGTHGAAVRGKYGVGGALAAARNGYQRLFADWLPALRNFRGIDETFPDETLIRLLLHIILTLDDSNVIFRAGLDGAAYAQEAVAKLIGNLSLQGLLQLNDDFKIRNISHGGAADMLALTLLADSLLQ